MVRDEPQTDAALLGDQGVLAGLAPGAVLVVMSTLSPAYCLRIAKQAAALGADVVDAPVSGGAPAASRGELSIMVGGSEAGVGRVRPLLELLGATIAHTGDLGSGQITKVVNNAIKIAILAATTEGLDLGARCGLRLDALRNVLRHSSADSHVLEHWDYYYSFKRDHRPRGPLEILHKDIGLALDLADEHGVDVPVCAAAGRADVGRLVGSP
jgi:3-hydroxyisobutyrate dehydrogenase-like beta-hydroxyacid dehydrogenase